MKNEEEAQMESTRVALVTGGGRGIGRAISLSLARAGVAVAVNFNRDEASAKQVVEEIVAAGGSASLFKASVTSPDELREMVGEVRATIGPVDVLVHNAGVISRGRSVELSSLDEVEQLMRVHAFGPFALTQLVLPGMREQARGDIVFISSITAHLCLPNGAPYQMAKLAAEGLAMTLAKEERPAGIRVNVVAPGVVETDMGRRLLKAVRGVDEASALSDELPYGRVCQPEDIAAAVTFLVSEAGSYINGQRLCVDGGGWHW